MRQIFEMLYSKEFRIGVSALLVGYAGYLIYDGYWGWSIWIILLAALVVLTIFRNEQIIFAMLQIRQGNIPKAEKALLRIGKPDVLIKSQQAYYHLLYGMILGQKITGMGNKALFDACEHHLRTALNLGLKQNPDIASAKLNLAGIVLAKLQTTRQPRFKTEATQLINDAKKLDTSGMMTDQIKQMKEVLKRF